MVYLTTDEGYRGDVAPARFHLVRDANRWNKLALAICALKVLAVVLRERPDVIISTGAAPGYLAIRFGRLVGARTIWLDSVANAEQLSMSGQARHRHRRPVSHPMATPREWACPLRGSRPVIFVTVGTQLPFDRLIDAVDRWAGEGEGREVFAQVGDSTLVPRHISYGARLTPRNAARSSKRRAPSSRTRAAGTILSALELGKPLSDHASQGVARRAPQRPPDRHGRAVRRASAA